MQRRHRQVGEQARGNGLDHGRPRHVDLDISAVGDEHRLEDCRQAADDERQAQHERCDHAYGDGADVELGDLAVAVAEDLHVADGACAAVDDRLGEQVDEQQEDEDRKGEEHADHLVHHARELVADGAHVVGRGLARKVERVKLELLVAGVGVEVVGIVAEELVEVVKAHVEVHVGP